MPRTAGRRKSSTIGILNVVASLRDAQPEPVSERPAYITRMATLSPGGRITAPVLVAEIERLKAGWSTPLADDDQDGVLATVLSDKAREKLGARRRLRSGIDAFKGIGAQMKKELLRTLGSLRAIEAADDATLLAVPGFTRRHLSALRKVIPTPKADAPR